MQKNLYNITFETKCYEKDWEFIVKTDRLKKVIENNCYDFKEKILYINNVNDIEAVKYHAQKLKDEGVITSFIVVDDYAQEALAFFGIDKESFKGGYYYSIQELVSIYLCKTEYLLHYSGDSHPEKPVDWIDTAIEKMKSDDRIKVANLTWNNCYDMAKKESFDEDDNFYIGYGFSDQSYLVRTKDFKDKIYNETHPSSERYPKYGGELFEKRVDAWMRNHQLYRITYKHGSYIHQNYEPANTVSVINSKKPIIYDCFTFFNEMELLELRLNELNDVVDKFVIVEAAQTHNNQPKPLYFNENKHLFSKFSNKFIHVIIKKFPEFTGNAWVNENYQRNCISIGLQKCNPEDIIIISDLDEIPRPDKITEAINIPGIKVFQQKFYNYFLNYLNPNETWHGSIMLQYKDFQNAQVLRNARNSASLVRIPDGGWHFTYIGGAEKIRNKLISFAHQEFNKENITDISNISQALTEGKDVLGRQGHTYFTVKIDESFPKYLLNNLEKFKPFIKEMDSSLVTS